MILKKNKYLKHFIALIILASCSSSSKNIQVNSIESKDSSPKDFQEIFDYQSFSLNDLETIKRIIGNNSLNQEQLKDAKLLKNNYQKILSTKKYSIELRSDQPHSKRIIELIYKFNLPMKISWDRKKHSSLPKSLFADKISGFCASIYEDAIASINKATTQTSDPILVIYSEEYASFFKDFVSNDANFIIAKYNSSSFQEFSAEVLGINFSEERFKKISDLNPNQNINFTPRPRADLKHAIILLAPQEYKSMIPALRYHGGSHFKYINFISSLEEISNPLQLLDYEDSWAPISKYITRKIQHKELESLERFLELGTLHEWLLIQILEQAGVKSAKINGMTGSIIFKSNSCTKRVIPLQKIRADLF